MQDQLCVTYVPSRIAYVRNICKLNVYVSHEYMYMYVVHVVLDDITCIHASGMYIRRQRGSRSVFVCADLSAVISIYVVRTYNIKIGTLAFVRPFR